MSVDAVIVTVSVNVSSPAEKERGMPTYDYDVLVVGAGQGGLPAAHMAANLGAKVALIEEREVGGT